MPLCTARPLRPATVTLEAPEVAEPWADVAGVKGAKPAAVLLLAEADEVPAATAPPVPPPNYRFEALDCVEVVAPPCTPEAAVVAGKPVSDEACALFCVAVCCCDAADSEAPEPDEVAAAPTTAPVEVLPAARADEATKARAARARRVFFMMKFSVVKFANYPVTDWTTDSMTAMGEPKRILRVILNAVRACIVLQYIEPIRFISIYVEWPIAETPMLCEFTEHDHSAAGVCCGSGHNLTMLDA